MATAQAVSLDRQVTEQEMHPMTDQPNPQHEPNPPADPVRALTIGQRMAISRETVRELRQIITGDLPDPSTSSRAMTCGLSAQFVTTLVAAGHLNVEAHRETCTEGPSCMAGPGNIVMPVHVGTLNALASVLRALSTDGSVTADHPSVAALIGAFVRDVEVGM